MTADTAEAATRKEEALAIRTGAAHDTTATATLILPKTRRPEAGLRDIRLLMQGRFYRAASRNPFPAAIRLPLINAARK